MKHEYCIWFGTNNIFAPASAVLLCLEEGLWNSQESPQESLKFQKD